MAFSLVNNTPFTAALPSSSNTLTLSSIPAPTIGNLVAVAVCSQFAVTPASGWTPGAGSSFGLLLFKIWSGGDSITNPFCSVAQMPGFVSPKAYCCAYELTGIAGSYSIDYFNHGSSTGSSNFSPFTFTGSFGSASPGTADAFLVLFTPGEGELIGGLPGAVISSPSFSPGGPAGLSNDNGGALYDSTGLPNVAYCFVGSKMLSGTPSLTASPSLTYSWINDISASSGVNMDMFAIIPGGFNYLQCAQSFLSVFGIPAVANARRRLPDVQIF